MNIEIPGLFTLSLNSLVLIFAVFLIVGSIRKWRNPTEQSSKITETDTLLLRGKSAQIVPYHKTGDITKLAQKSNNNVIVVADVRGTILNSAHAVSILGRRNATFGEDLGNALDQIAKIPEVKAVIVRNSTPGGTVTGSAHIANGIQKCIAAGKLVVGFIPDISASGGVWSMAPASHVIANEHALIGSIGVRGPQIFEYSGVTSMGGIFGGVSAKKITSTPTFAGEGKTFGDPFIPTDQKQVAHFQALLADAYGKFLDHVSKHRTVSKESIRKIGARILSAEDALAHKLIDQIGDIDEVTSYVASKINVPWNQCGIAYLKLGVQKDLAGLFAESALATMNTYAGVKNLQVADVLAQETVSVMYTPPGYNNDK